MLTVAKYADFRKICRLSQNMQTVAKYADCRKIQSGFSQLIQTETRNKRIHNTVLKLTRPGLHKSISVLFIERNKTKR